MKTRLLIPLAFASACAPLAGPVLNPANGHYYEAIPNTTLDWTDAKAVAETLTHLGAGGHLATLTSLEEQNFVVNNLPDATGGYFLGGFQGNNIDWLWVTGEPFLYANWFSGEPNNFQGNAEDYLQFHGFLQNGNPTGFWNDVRNFSSTGYVVEFEPHPVPEAPSTGRLLVLGVCGILFTSHSLRLRMPTASPGEFCSIV